jgi:hypothetical protein
MKTQYEIEAESYIKGLGRGYTKEAGNRNTTAISEKFRRFQEGNWFPD